MTMSSNKPTDTAPPTLDEVAAKVKEALSVPMPMGMMLGVVVYLNRWDHTITFGGVTMSAHDPLLNGSELQRRAIELLGDGDGN